MTKTMILLLALSSIVSIGATAAEASDHPKNSKDQITATGCLARQNTDYILTQADQGNSYQLARTKGLRFAPYLGQQVEVKGTQSPSMSTSSDFLARSGSASPVTIQVTSIKTIAKRCSD